MIIFKCDKCGKEVAELNHFTMTYRHKNNIGFDEIQISSELRLNHGFELCNECSEKLFKEFNLEVKS